MTPKRFQPRNISSRLIAQSLASAIKGWKGNDSLVIALYGSWGSGKSSVKNMVLETLRSSESNSPSSLSSIHGNGQDTINLERPSFKRSVWYWADQTEAKTENDVLPSGGRMALTSRSVPLSANRLRRSCHCSDYPDWESQTCL